MPNRKCLFENSSNDWRLLVTTAHGTVTASEWSCWISGPRISYGLQ